MHFVRANFASFRTPCGRGHPEIRSVALPLPTATALLMLRRGPLRLPMADNSHTCRPRSIFSDVHAAGENDCTLFAPPGANSVRLFRQAETGGRCSRRSFLIPECPWSPTDAPGTGARRRIPAASSPRTWTSRCPAHQSPSSAPAKCQDPPAASTWTRWRPPW